MNSEILNIRYEIEFIDMGDRFFYIDEYECDFEISKEEAIIMVAQKQNTVKVNGLEDLVDGSNTVHMFISPKDAVSFPRHIDYEDLIILSIDGIKIFEVDGEDYKLYPGDLVEVPKGVEHRAKNKYDSVILSIEMKK